MSQAAGQVNILIFILKIKFSPCMPINFVMQGKCLFSDISRPGTMLHSIVVPCCTVLWYTAAQCCDIVYSVLAFYYIVAPFCIVLWYPVPQLWYHTEQLWYPGTHCCGILFHRVVIFCCTVLIIGAA